MANIVVLDCNANRREWYGATLSGHLVTFVETPARAVRLALLTHADLIIAEWFDSSGKDVITELQRIREIVPPPVILTADLRVLGMTERVTQRALLAGAAGFIPLPMAKVNFCLFIQAALAKQRMGARALIHIREIAPPPITADELVALLLEVQPVRMMIEQTVGCEVLNALLTTVVETESVDEARRICGVVIEWSRDEMPALRAAQVSADYGDKIRAASQELLFLIAHGMLFPPSMVA